MQGKHTPGPWHNSAVYVKMNDGIPILCTADRSDETPEGYTYVAATVPAFTEPSEEQLANAALIAASPELLGMLGEAVRLAGEGRAMSGDTLRAARALMMKAVGLIALAVSLSGCSTTETRYAVEYRADATRPAEGVIVAGVSGGFSSVLR